MSTFKILVVDDFEPFRRFACSKLEERPSFQIVGEASDGVDAVRRAVELQPDLILLDIGLPVLNGIKAARQIRKHAPGLKIVFVSLDSSPDVVQEVLALGNCGYVHKARAENDLLDAVEAVRQGRQFVST